MAVSINLVPVSVVVLIRRALVFWDLLLGPLIFGSSLITNKALPSSSTGHSELVDSVELLGLITLALQITTSKTSSTASSC